MPVGIGELGYPFTPQLGRRQLLLLFGPGLGRQLVLVFLAVILVVLHAPGMLGLDLAGALGEGVDHRLRNAGDLPFLAAAPVDDVAQAFEPVRQA